MKFTLSLSLSKHIRDKYIKEYTHYVKEVSLYSYDQGKLSL